MRQLLNVSFSEEQLLIENIAAELIRDGFNSSNTIIVTVSTDYSSIIGQTLRHLLSADGEICDGFGVDVPYPDENWDESYVSELNNILDMYQNKIGDKRILMVEAGVIRGGNYTFLENHLRERGLANIYSLSMFENIWSAYKSDYVGEYYNNETHDLTFWWERENNHWI
jgi:hypothetical protein